YSENGIFSGTESFSAFQVPGFTARSSVDTTAAYDNIGPGYVRAIGAHLLEGREFSATDDQRSPRVALVNAAMAKFYFPGQSAIGKTLVFSDTVSVSIVGVIPDIRDHDLATKPPRRFYQAYLQSRLGDALRLVVVGVLVGAPLAVAATRLLRNQLHDVHPADPVAIASALLVLTAGAIIAALLPARRAARLDPLSALRAE